LAHHGVIAGQTQCPAVFQGGRQTEAGSGLGGEDDQRIGLLAVAVQSFGAEP
jgi:hypothetical protein